MSESVIEIEIPARFTLPDDFDDGVYAEDGLLIFDRLVAEIDAVVAHFQNRIRSCKLCHRPFLAESYQTQYCSKKHADTFRKRTFRTKQKAA
jgi:hypothetical protein